MHRPTLADVAAWSNVLAAFKEAARGKTGKGPVARFAVDLAEHLLTLQAELQAGTYRPGPYRQFVVHEAKRRLISAAPFRDRVVHHALVRQMTPVLEAQFSAASFANRPGLGTHRAIDRFQAFARQYRYVLRMDVVRHFPSIDHAILQAYLRQWFPDDGLQALVATILTSGQGLEGAAPPCWLPGDGLFDGVRPRGLPIGNLTSQIWSNAYLDPVDHFVTDTLGCRAYVRYVDDFAFFADAKRALWSVKAAVIEALAERRLRVHTAQAQVMPTAVGVPWLGFVVWPDRRRVKARKVRHFTRRFREQWTAYRDGRITFAELDASVGGFLAHVAHAEAHGLVRHLFGAWPANEPPRRWRPKLLR